MRVTSVFNYVYIKKSVFFYIHISYKDVELCLTHEIVQYLRFIAKDLLVNI
jgi:hypothetical protein